MLACYPMTPTGFKEQFIRLRWDDGSPRAHPDLAERLVADATKDGTSRTEVILRILSKTYGVELEERTRRPSGNRPSTDAFNFTVRIPTPLHEAIRVSAFQRGAEVVDEILRALSAHYGLPMYAKPARARKPRRARAAA